MAAISSASAIDLGNLKPTGFGVPADGVDDYYSLELPGGSAGTSYIIGGAQPLPWYDDSLVDGKWIGPTNERNGDNSSSRDGGVRVSNSPETPLAGAVPETAGAYYKYSITFNLDGADLDSFAIFGKWASDNSSFIQLNPFTGPTSSSTSAGGFGELTDFFFDEGFVDGDNELVFFVSNDSSPAKRDSSPTGLLVASIAAVPEPTTIVGLGLAGLMAGFVGYRRRKSSSV